MADWSAVWGPQNGDGGSLHSRESSVSSDRSRSASSLSRQDSDNSFRVLLSGGHQLTEESGTEQTRLTNGLKSNGSNGTSIPAIPPRQPSRKMKPAPSLPSVTAKDDDSLSEVDIVIPNDGCLYNFTADEMSVFFRHMCLNERLIKHLNNKNVDGKRFSRFKDSDMDNVGIRNPILTYFRDKSIKKNKAKIPFIL